MAAGAERKNSALYSGLLLGTSCETSPHTVECLVIGDHLNMEKEVDPGVPALNANAVTSAGVVASAVVAASVGTDNIEKIADIAVSVVKQFKVSVPNESFGAKVGRFSPVFLGGLAAWESFAKLLPELKDINADEVKALAKKYSPQFGVTGKAEVYVEESFNVLASALRMIQAK